MGRLVGAAHEPPFFGMTELGIGRFVNRPYIPSWSPFVGKFFEPGIAPGSPSPIAISNKVVGWCACPGAGLQYEGKSFILFENSLLE